MKVVFHKDIGGELAVVDLKVEDKKLKLSAELDLDSLVDKGAEAIPGEGFIEKMVVTGLKQLIENFAK